MIIDHEKMSIAQIQPKTIPHIQKEETLQVNIDSLLLAMITAFNINVTQKSLFANILTLFKELNLVIPDGLTSEISKSVAILTANNYLIQKKDGYVVTEEGRLIGKRALMNFQDSIIEFF